MPAGFLLAEFRSPRLEAELATACGAYDSYRVEADVVGGMLREATDSEEIRQLEAEKQEAIANEQQAKAKVDVIEQQLDRLRERGGMRAPYAGVVLGAPRLEEVGREFQRDQSQPFCSIGDTSKLILLVPVSPADYQLLRNDLAELKELSVDVRVPGRKAETVPGRVVRLPELDAKDVPMALTHKCGGPLAVKQGSDPNVNAPQNQQYLVTIELPHPDDAIVPGSLVRVKIHCKWKTSAWWVWHTISSAFDLGLM